MAERVDTRIIPPSIHDARSQAFGEAVRQALADPNFKQLLFEWLDTVDPRLFPFLIREFGLQHFVEPGMSEAVIRRLLKGSLELHRKMGFITGVRTGLDMLGDLHHELESMVPADAERCRRHACRHRLGRR